MIEVDIHCIAFGNIRATIFRLKLKVLFHTFDTIQQFGHFTVNSEAVFGSRHTQRMMLLPLHNAHMLNTFSFDLGAKPFAFTKCRIKCHLINLSSNILRFAQTMSIEHVVHITV